MFSFFKNASLIGKEVRRVSSGGFGSNMAYDMMMAENQDKPLIITAVEDGEYIQINNWVKANSNIKCGFNIANFELV